MRIFDVPEEMTRRDRIRLRIKAKPKVREAKDAKHTATKRYKLARRARPTDIMAAIAQDEAEVAAMYEGIAQREQIVRGMIEHKEAVAEQQAHERYMRSRADELRRTTALLMKEAGNRAAEADDLIQKAARLEERIHSSYYCSYYNCYM